MIPANDWWNVLSNFNEFIMPFQFIWAGIAIILTIRFLIKTDKLISFLLKTYFVISFAFISIVFFAIKGQALPAFIGQTICFGSLAILFAIDLWVDKLPFVMPQKIWQKIVMTVSFFFVFLYPVVGLFAGHSYPRMILVGTFPCPTTALGLVFVTGSLSKLKIEWQSFGVYAIWVLLLVWAIPFPIAIQIPKFGVYEDSIMLLIGIYGLAQLIIAILQKFLNQREEKIKYFDMKSKNNQKTR